MDRKAWLAVSVGLVAGAVATLWAGPASAWLSLGLAVLCAVAGALAGRRARLERADSIPEVRLEQNLPVAAREILEHLAVPVLLLDASGRVILANKAMRAVIGLDAQKKPVAAVFRTPSVLEAVERTRVSGEPSSIAFTVHVPLERHYEAHVTRVGQDPPLTALLLHDLTAIRRAEEARADFVANASHELRTPLAAVSGFIETLKGHARDDAEAREKFLDIMSVESGRMRRLIDDLLSLTRIEQNEHVPPSGRVDLESVVRDAAAALTPLAAADEVEIRIEAPAALPQVTGQRDELIQLFQNLIHNAIKYGRRGGHVWLTLSAVAGQSRRGAGAMVAVSVRDDGEGIPREAIPRLTERFYRVDVKRSRERGGTGLGLAIVKHIVSRHQGRLSIESQPGQGSNFTVTLPAAPAAELEPRGVTEAL
ncbi:MAG: hypothetical protein KGO02_10370 [Alphaproteobacteria bacterium]|nr:hypothetical protein [Alphaproteobacteria bacterium]